MIACIKRMHGGCMFWSIINRLGSVSQKKKKKKTWIKTVLLTNLIVYQKKKRFIKKDKPNTFYIFIIHTHKPKKVNPILH